MLPEQDLEISCERYTSEMEEIKQQNACQRLCICPSFCEGTVIVIVSVLLMTWICLITGIFLWQSDVEVLDFCGEDHFIPIVLGGGKYSACFRDLVFAVPVALVGLFVIPSTIKRMMAMKKGEKSNRNVEAPKVGILSILSQFVGVSFLALTHLDVFLLPSSFPKAEWYLSTGPRVACVALLFGLTVVSWLKGKLLDNHVVTWVACFVITNMGVHAYIFVTDDGSQWYYPLLPLIGFFFLLWPVILCTATKGRQPINIFQHLSLWCSVPNGRPVLIAAALSAMCAIGSAVPRGIYEVKFWNATSVGIGTYISSDNFNLSSNADENDSPFNNIIYEHFKADLWYNWTVTAGLFFFFEVLQELFAYVFYVLVGRLFLWVVTHYLESLDQTEIAHSVSSKPEKFAQASYHSLVSVASLVGVAIMLYELSHTDGPLTFLLSMLALVVLFEAYFHSQAEGFYELEINRVEEYMAFIAQRPTVDSQALEFWSTRTVFILLAHNFWQLIHHSFLPFLNLPIFPCLAMVAFFQAGQPGQNWGPMKFMAFITNAIALLREVHFVTGAFAHFATLNSNYKPIQNLLEQNNDNDHDGTEHRSLLSHKQKKHIDYHAISENATVFSVTEQEHEDKQKIDKKDS